MGLACPRLLVVVRVTSHARTALTDHPERAEQVDERSERWVTAVHEAGHVVAVEQFGGRVLSCRLDEHDDGRGNTRHTVETGGQRAVVAVAGERATRLLLGTGGGSGIDYRDAAHALHGTGRGVDWAEHHADVLVRACRRDILREARHLYRRGHR